MTLFDFFSSCLCMNIHNVTRIGLFFTNCYMQLFLRKMLKCQKKPKKLSYFVKKLALRVHFINFAFVLESFQPPQSNNC